MEKKIICILVSMLMCATVFTVTGTKNFNAANEVINWVTETTTCNRYEDWLHYDDGTCENSLGLTAGGVLHEVIKLTPTELTGYDNHWFTCVKVMHGCPLYPGTPAQDYVIWMYTGTNHPTDPMTEATIVATGNSGAVDDYIFVNLSTPYEFDPTDTVWIGVGWTHNAGTYPCGFDEDTNVAGKGGWLFYGTSWTELGSIGYPGSWNLWVQVEPANQPPVTPDAPDGPENGIVGVNYPFTASTTDPEGDPIEYWFEWGDGENSGWVSSGNAQHAWTTAGNFEVTVKARDINGGESDFSPAHVINIVSGPIIKLDKIFGSLFMVKAEIYNNGATTATNVKWSITLEGGAWINKVTNGTVDSLPAGEKKSIQSKFIIGWGKTKVTVTAEVPESSDLQVRNGNIYLFFVKVNPGGG